MFTPSLIYALYLGGIALLLGAIGLFVLRRRSRPVGRSFALLALLAAVWCGTYLPEFLTVDLAWRIRIWQVRHLISPFFGVTVVWLVLTFCGWTDWIRPRRFAPQLLVPVLAALLALTVDWQPWFATDFRIVAGELRDVLVYEEGIGFWIAAGYAALVSLLAIGILLRAWSQSRQPLFRRQALLLVAALLIPWSVDFMATFHRPLWFGGIYLTHLALPLMVLCMAWALFRHGLYDLAAIAREQVMEEIPDGVLVFDAQGRLTDLNRAACCLLELDARALGQSAAALLAPWPDLADGPDAAGIRPAAHQTDGAPPRLLEGRWSPLRGPGGMVRGQVLLLHDITERRRMEEALCEARDRAESANRAKSAFLANMSHEIRTPLNVMLGFAQVLLRDSVLTTGQRDGMRAILRSGGHLLELINEVLDLARIEAGGMALHPEPFDLPAFLSDLAAFFQQHAESRGLCLRLELDRLPHQVTGDATRLRQVLINLIGNAIKFTQHGTVYLRCGVAAERRIQFSVADTGPGIAPDALGQLFRPFVQTATGRQQQEGAGLGLALSHQLVRLMGGSLEAESTLGAGSRFFFSLALTPMSPLPWAETASAVSLLPPSAAAARFAAAPLAWRFALREAVTLGDFERMSELLDTLHDERLREQLRQWIHDYDLDALSRLTRA